MKKIEKDCLGSKSKSENLINNSNYLEAIARQNLILVTDLLSLSDLSSSPYLLIGQITNWIEKINEQENINGKPETMIPRSIEKIKSYFEDRRAVMLLEKVGNEYLAAGFCALPYDLDEMKPGRVLELGTLIRSPITSQRNIGIIATLSTLNLPKAKNAELIIAYANKNSLPLFLRMGARVIEADELKQSFIFLPEYSGDTIVDLTPIRS